MTKTVRRNYSVTEADFYLYIKGYPVDHVKYRESIGICCYYDKDENLIARWLERGGRVQVRN
jgi:hypothetical protein